MGQNGAALSIRGWRNGVSPVVLNRSIDIISPPPRLSPSQWAEEFAYLPQEQNAEPGKFRLARRPHQAAMLDDPLDPDVREIFWMGASQAMGKTICFILLIEYDIHQLKKSIVMVRPTLDACLDWMREKLLPTVEATPCMDGLLVDPRKRDSRSTSLNRRFPGGSLRLIGANSPSGFRGSSAGIVLQDEVDADEDTKEGDSCALADRAAINFSDAWLIKASTTTLEGFSRIHAGYKQGDQQLYFLPCPHCGGFQHLKTEQMKFSFTPEEHARLGDETKGFKEIVNSHTWEIGEFPIRDTPRSIYVCEHCRRGWTDDQRIESYFSGHADNPAVMVNGQALRAHWQATAPFNGVRSRGINGMYIISGLKRKFDNYLHMFAENFLAAKRGGRQTLMTWTNIFKNEPFAEPSEKMEWAPIKERAEDMTQEMAPQAIVVLGTMDVQREPPRVEIMWVAYGAEQEMWLLDWETIPGDLDMSETQKILSAHLFSKTFHHPYLGQVAPYAFGIDYGYQTKVKAVYRFCRDHKFKKIFATKGFPHEQLSSLSRYEYDRREKCRKFYFNVDVLKSDVFDRLRVQEPGQRYIHIPKAVITAIGPDGKPRLVKTKFDDRFYEELCSERRVTKRNKDGTLSYRWKKISDSARNEPLDLIGYNIGLYGSQGLDARIGQEWKRVQELMRKKEAEEAKEAVAATSPSVPSHVPVPMPVPARKELTEEEMRTKEVPIHQPVSNGGRAPRGIARRPMRRPRPNMPPWARGMGNPFG